MTVRVPTVARVRSRPSPGGLAVGAAVLCLALVLLAAALLSLPKADATAGGVSTALIETAAVLDAHGAAMGDDGRRLADVARAATDPNRDHWIADAQQMAADGAGLQALAQRLRAAARLLGDHPTGRSSVDLSTISGEAGALIAEGQAAIDHGQAMRDHANAMLLLARQPASGITEADAQLMADAAPRIIDTGERVKRVGLSLRSFADQMRRSLGQ